MRYLVILFYGLLCFASCSEPSTYSPPPPGDDEKNLFELAWATRMEINDEWITTDHAHIWQDWYVKGGDVNDGFTVHFYDKKTGDKDWVYVNAGTNNSAVVNSTIIENIYFGINSRGIVALNLELKSLLWELDFQALNMSGNFSISYWKGYLYHSVDQNFKEENHTHKLLKINIEDGSFEELYSSEIQNDYYGGLSPVTFYEDSQNNRDLMIANLYPDAGWVGPTFRKQKIWIYDLNAEKEILQTEIFNENISSNKFHAPIVYGDKVITGADWSIYSFEIMTGELLWRYQFDYPWGVWSKTNHLIHKDKLFVNNSQYDVTSLNPDTGELIWNNPQGGPSCTDNMLYYKDMLIFTSWGFGSVMILDALTGETLHREKKYEGSNYNNDIAFDEETDMFFTSTYKHAVGFKIEK